MTKFLPLLMLAGACLSVPAWPGEETAISIDNFTFSPSKVTISKGSEVTWKNQDDIPHSIVLGALGAHSKAMDTDGSFTYRFDKAGTFSYVCGLHPAMHGTVVVK